MKTGVITTVIILVLVLGGIYLLSTSPGNSEPMGEEDVKVFKITGNNFRFFMDGIESPDLRVNEGDRVRIDFTNEEGFHDWKIDEFNASTAQISAGQSESIEFVADRKGTFEYYCSVGQHRANGMKGNLIVE